MSQFFGHVSQRFSKLQCQASVRALSVGSASRLERLVKFSLRGQSQPNVSANYSTNQKPVAAVSNHTRKVNRRAGHPASYPHTPPSSGFAGFAEIGWNTFYWPPASSCSNPGNPGWPIAGRSSLKLARFASSSHSMNSDLARLSLKVISNRPASSFTGVKFFALQ